MGILIALSSYMVFMMLFVVIIHLYGKQVPYWLCKFKIRVTRDIFSTKKKKVKYRSRLKIIRYHSRVRIFLIQRHGTNGVYSNAMSCKYIWVNHASQILKFVYPNYYVWGSIHTMAVNVTNNEGKLPKLNEFDNYAVSMNSTIRFNMDSCPIKIDNSFTQAISGFKDDFLPGTLKNVNNLVVKGFANTKTAISLQGTILWNIVDDDGKFQQIVINNAYLGPGCGVWLLPPQHWS
jgi:hypothetical protein